MLTVSIGGVEYHLGPPNEIYPLPLSDKNKSIALLLAMLMQQPLSEILVPLWATDKEAQTWYEYHYNRLGGNMELVVEQLNFWLEFGPGAGPPFPGPPIPIPPPEPPPLPPEPILPDGGFMIIAWTVLKGLLMGLGGGAVLRWIMSKAVPVLTGTGTGLKIAAAWIPGWLKPVLIFFGIDATRDIVVELLDGDDADVEDWKTGAPGVEPPQPPGLPGTGIGPWIGGPLVAGGIIGSWIAGTKERPITFYRLWDGRLAVQRKDGRWKVWRPKRPIVLMPGGTSNLRALLRADAVVDRQIKRLSKSIRRRGYGKRAGKKEIIIESGPGHVIKA